MTFKHLVGKSTLKEGITIYKNFEDFFESPESGSKREITLLYGDNQSVKAILRRLNNIRNHVHIINRLIIVWTYGMCLWYIYMHENERCSEVGS